MLAKPAALAPEAGGEQSIGEVSGAAEAFGVRPGMPLSEALSRCPGLVLVPPDPGRAESLWEHSLQRLEGIGAEVEPARAGEAFFSVDGAAPHLGPESRAGAGQGGPHPLATRPASAAARPASAPTRSPPPPAPAAPRSSSRRRSPAAACSRCRSRCCASASRARRSRRPAWSRRWSGSASRRSATLPACPVSPSPIASAGSACAPSTSRPEPTPRCAPAGRTRSSCRRSACPRPPTEPSSTAPSTC